MTYKCVFSDIDGTLLNSNHQISERTKNKIQELYQRNSQNGETGWQGRSAAERCKPSERQKSLGTARTAGERLAVAVRQNENPAWTVSGSIHLNYGRKWAVEKGKWETGFTVQAVS